MGCHQNLDEVLAHQKPFSDKSGLGFTRESSSSANVSKEMKFVKAKELVVATPTIEKVKFEKKPKLIAQRILTKPPNPVVNKPKVKGKSLLKSQRGPQTQHFCHHCGIRGHTKPNCQVLKGQEDKEMARVTLSNQKGEKLILILVM